MEQDSSLKNFDFPHSEFKNPLTPSSTLPEFITKRKTDLMFAIESEATQAVMQILESRTPGRLFGYYTVDLNATDEDGKTALMYAIESGNSDIVQRILDGTSHGFFGKYATNVHMFDKTGRTALVYAMELGKLALMHLTVKGVQREILYLV